MKIEAKIIESELKKIVAIYLEEEFNRKGFYVEVKPEQLETLLDIIDYGDAAIFEGFKFEIEI